MWMCAPWSYLLESTLRHVDHGAGTSFALSQGEVNANRYKAGKLKLPERRTDRLDREMPAAGSFG